MISKIIKSIELLLVAIVREFLAIPAYVTLFFAEVAKTYSRIRYRQQMLSNKRRDLNVRRERERLAIKAKEAELAREKAKQKLEKKLEDSKLPCFWERWRLRRLEAKIAKQKREAEEARKEHELELAEENEHALELARQRELSAIQASNEAREARENNSVPKWLPLWAQNLLSKKVLWFVAIVIALFVANSYFGFVTFEKDGSAKSGSVKVTHGNNNSEDYPTLEEKK